MSFYFVLLKTFGAFVDVLNDRRIFGLLALVIQYQPNKSYNVPCLRASKCSFILYHLKY